MSSSQDAESGIRLFSNSAIIKDKETETEGREKVKSCFVPKVVLSSDSDSEEEKKLSEAVVSSDSILSNSAIAKRYQDNVRDGMYIEDYNTGAAKKKKKHKLPVDDTANQNSEPTKRKKKEGKTGAVV